MNIKIATAQKIFRSKPERVKLSPKGFGFKVNPLKQIQKQFSAAINQLIKAKVSILTGNYREALTQVQSVVRTYEATLPGNPLVESLKSFSENVFPNYRKRMSVTGTSLISDIDRSMVTFSENAFEFLMDIMNQNDDIKQAFKSRTALILSKTFSREYLITSRNSGDIRDEINEVLKEFVPWELNDSIIEAAISIQEQNEEETVKSNFRSFKDYFDLDLNPGNTNKNGRRVLSHEETISLTTEDYQKIAGNVVIGLLVPEKYLHRISPVLDLEGYKKQLEGDMTKAKQRLQQLRINEEVRRQKDELLRAEIAARPTTTSGDILQHASTAPTTSSHYRIPGENKPAPLPKIELPKLFERINKILASESDAELLQLSLSAIIDRYPTPNNYWQIANEELGTDAVTHLKPILDIHYSYLDPGRKEEYTELTKLLKIVNLVSKEQYSPLTRDDLLTVLDSINKLINKEYDPLFSNGIFTTDVTSGLRNTIDETVLHAYEEKLAVLKSASYDLFIQELKETNGVKNLGMGELELRRRIECKLALTSNDYHIIQAFRKLTGGHDGKPVPTSDVEAELKRNHVEFNWNEVSDLNARLETLKEYFPKLMGVSESTNKSNGELIVGLHCPGLSLLGFEDGACPTTGEVFWARNRLKKRAGDEADVVYEQFKAHRGRLKVIVTIEHTVDGKPQRKKEERHVDNGAYRELCEQFQANKEKNK